MRAIAILAIAAVGAGCVPAPGAGPAPGQAAAPPACRTTSAPLTVGGRPELATIEACPLPDGSWRITQTTPGLPPQVYVMPATPADLYPAAYPDEGDYFDAWPLWGGGPWFWGIGPTIVIVRHVHEHMHMHEFAGDHGGFAHRAPHGIGHAVAAAPAGGGMRR